MNNKKKWIILGLSWCLVVAGYKFYQKNNMSSVPKTQEVKEFEVPEPVIEDSAISFNHPDEYYEDPKVFSEQLQRIKYHDASFISGQWLKTSKSPWAALYIQSGMESECVDSSVFLNPEGLHPKKLLEEVAADEKQYYKRLKSYSCNSEGFIIPVFSSKVQDSPNLLWIHPLECFDFAASTEKFDDSFYKSKEVWYSAIEKLDTKHGESVYFNANYDFLYTSGLEVYQYQRSDYKWLFQARDAFIKEVQKDDFSKPRWQVFNKNKIITGGIDPTCFKNLLETLKNPPPRN